MEVAREGDTQVSEIQRSRLLVAAVGALDQFGYDGASVARITTRAGISRRTFYELFENREQCVLAVLESAIALFSSEVAATDLEDAPWQERVRSGLWVMLSLLDREPALARVCVVETQRAGQGVSEFRRAILDRLAELVDRGAKESAPSMAPGPLTAQGVVGGVFSIVHEHLSDRTQTVNLRSLLGELMAMIVLPYKGPKSARREQERSAPAPVPAIEEGAQASDSYDRLAQIPMRLTYRTVRVLRDVGEHPGSSNRQIARRAGIEDQGQMSKLLARLQRIGLLSNQADNAIARGEANAWSLTPTGEQITSTIATRALVTPIITNKEQR